MLNRRQAIIWTDADPIHWNIYVALGEMSKDEQGEMKVALQWVAMFLQLYTNGINDLVWDSTKLCAKGFALIYGGSSCTFRYVYDKNFSWGMYLHIVAMVRASSHLALRCHTTKSCTVLKQWDMKSNPITLKFARCLSSRAARVPVKFQIDMVNLIANLEISRDLVVIHLTT